MYMTTRADTFRLKTNVTQVCRRIVKADAADIDVSGLPALTYQSRQRSWRCARSSS